MSLDATFKVLPGSKSNFDTRGHHSSHRTHFHKKHIPRSRTCETDEGNHDPPDHAPASGALGSTVEEGHGWQDLLSPFQRNWHKNHDCLCCSPVPTNTFYISWRHFRICTFHNTCISLMSLCPGLFCTHSTFLQSPLLLSQSHTLLGW